MNGLKVRQTSKTFGFLRGSENAARLLGSVIGVLLLLLFVAYARAQEQAAITAERMDAHTILFTYEGKQYMGFDLERSKELKKAENDAASFNQQLQLCKANVQDERVRYSNLKQLYDDQSVLFASCMKLSKSGSSHGILDNFWVRLGIDVAPTVTNFARGCK